MVFSSRIFSTAAPNFAELQLHIYVGLDFKPSAVPVACSFHMTPFCTCPSRMAYVKRAKKKVQARSARSRGL